MKYLENKSHKNGENKEKIEKNKRKNCKWEQKICYSQKLISKA